MLPCEQLLEILIQSLTRCVKYLEMQVTQTSKSLFVVSCDMPLWCVVDLRKYALFEIHAVSIRTDVGQLTKASLFPTSLLNKADLPTLGLPTIATCAVSKVNAGVISMHVGLGSYGTRGRKMSSISERAKQPE